MPYISNTGTIQESQQPLTISWFRDTICGFFTFIYLFFASLFGLKSTTESKDKYKSDYRDRFRRDGPGGGGPGSGPSPPRRRNIGTLGGGGGPSCPPMSGGG